MGRSPQREERLAAATLDIALQVYHTYTYTPTRMLTCATLCSGTWIGLPSWHLGLAPQALSH
jgi:hypothetical protein